MDEFLVDSELEFHKIKKFLSNSNEILIEEPEIREKYKSLIGLLKRRRIVEQGYSRYEYNHKYGKTDSQSSILSVKYMNKMLGG
jgi:hypothetical protein